MLQVVFFCRYTMLPVSAWFVNKMLNLSKNVIKLLNTHPVVGIEPVWILSQIFIKSVKFTKLLTTLVYRVYPIAMMHLPSTEKQCCSCLSSIHGNFMEIWLNEKMRMLNTLNHTNGKTNSS